MEIIHTKVLNGNNSNKSGITAVIIGMIGISLTIYISVYLTHSIFIGFIGFFISFSPVIFEKKYQERFMINTTVSFSEEKINLKLFDRLSDNLINDYDFEYKQIESFLAKDATKDSGSYLNLKMKNKDSYSFRFLGEEKTEITNLVFKYILKFNESILNKEDKIKLTFGFFATKSGKIAVYVLTIVLLITLIIELIFLEKRQSYLIIPGIVIYLGILLQRKNDLDTVKKWNDKYNG